MCMHTDKSGMIFVWPSNAILLLLVGRQRLPDRAKHVSVGWKKRQVKSFGALISKLFGQRVSHDLVSLDNG